MSSDTLVHRKVAALDLWLRELQEDPDRKDEEYDVWVQSRCGRSSKTVTICGLNTEEPIDFGVWTGSPCHTACLKICWCRVGSCNIRAVRVILKHPLEALELNLPGEPIIVGPIELVP